MRKRVLGILAVGVFGLFGLTTWLAQPEKQYEPRFNNSEARQEAQGMLDYLQSMRANQITGEISQADVVSAKLAVESMSANKSAALGLNWELVGPDNVGGRTRDFIIDRSNSNTLYMAGVAGGIYKSTNAGLSWIDISDDLDNLAVVSLAQAANGDLYAGTGERMFAFFTFGQGTATSPGMTGGGIYKSTDGGATWTALTSTVPPANNNSDSWSSIGALGADPTNANRIYAGTFGGLRRSDDGGATWSSPVSSSIASGRCADLTVAADGSVWASVGDRAVYSPNGNDNTWVEKSKLIVGSTDIPRNNNRQLFAVSRQDQDIVYLLQSAGSGLRAIYRTTDRGDNWTVIAEPTSLWDPLCDLSGSANGCIGDWARLLQVDPNNSNKIFVGGLRLWEWQQNTGWRRVDSPFNFPGNPFYVHADNHKMRFDPNNSNIVYHLSDGGLAKSSDGGLTWGQFNKNYVTTQFYHMGVGQDRIVTGGTQDNGTWIINGTGNTPFEGERAGAIAYQGGGGHAGDGGYSLISWLDDDIYFTSYQLGTMGRSENRGESYSSFWDPRQLTNCQPWYGRNCTFSSWMVPFYLHETTNDPLSNDSIWFVARPASMSLGFGNGDTTFMNTLSKPQPASQFETSTFEIEAGSLLVTSDANGNLMGDGTGTFDPATGNYTVTFAKPPLAEIVVTCQIRYNSGSNIEVASNINGLPYNYALNTSISPNDSLQIQDPVQSTFAIGLNGTVWITRMALNLRDQAVWYKVANTGGVVQSITMSADANYVWAGTENGRLIRVSNVQQARSVATGDIDETSTVLVDFATVATFSGRNVTGIAVDPNNPDRVVVTVGNYGNSTYVYYSDDATSASPTFSTVQGNLPNFPVYTATFDKANPSHVIIGTEYGIWATEDIDASNVNWTEENGGMNRIPVFHITQYRSEKSSPSASEPVLEGDLFIATHARGLLKATDLQTSRPVSVEEEDMPTASAPAAQLNMYPNPATDFTVVEFKLNKREDVTIFVRDINGRLVNQLRFNKLSAGDKEIRINTSELSAGTYLMSVQQGEKVTSGKFVVSR